MSLQRTAIDRTLVRLGLGELVAAAVFALIAVRATAGSPASAVPVCSALVPLLVVLVQAGAYWLVRGRWRRLPRAMVATYRTFRIVDAVLLALGLVGVALAWPAKPAVAVAVVAVWLFGVVEYVNYFIVRLAYPPSRWFAEVGRLRTPRLVKDVAG